LPQQFYRVSHFNPTEIALTAFLSEHKKIEIYLFQRWFEPFVMQWLNENDDMSMEYLHNALEKDRQTGVNKI